MSENTISDWKTLIHTRVADFLVSNPSPLGGPGVVVEMDEAKLCSGSASITKEPTEKDSGYLELSIGAAATASYFPVIATAEAHLLSFH